jgi:hypothetical protein
MRLAQVAAGVLVGVAVLAGCSSKEPANDTLPTPSATSAEASETLPPLGPADFPMPAEARERTAEGVEAFTGYYIALINRLLRDLDATYLTQFSRTCSTCDRIARDASSDKASGYSYQGGILTVTSLGLATLTDEGGELAFVVEQEALEVLDASGGPVPDLSTPRLTALPAGLSTVWDTDHWLVSSLSFG